MGFEADPAGDITIEVTGHELDFSWTWPEGLTPAPLQFDANPEYARYPFPTPEWIDMPATPPLEPPVGTIKPADDDTAAAPDMPGVHVTMPKPMSDTLPLDTIKAAIKERVDVTSLRLDDLRRERDLLNANVKTARAKVERDIKEAVAELAEAKRIANSLTPRKPRTKKAPK